MPPELRLELKAVKAEPRGSRSAAQLMAAEAARIEAAIPRGARRICLDERGERVTSAELAARIAAGSATAATPRSSSAAPTGSTGR